MLHCELKWEISRSHSVSGSQEPNDFERLVLIQENNGLPRQTPLTLSVQS